MWNRFRFTETLPSISYARNPFYDFLDQYHKLNDKQSTTKYNENIDHFETSHKAPTNAYTRPLHASPAVKNYSPRTPNYAPPKVTLHNGRQTSTWNQPSPDSSPVFNSSVRPERFESRSSEKVHIKPEVQFKPFRLQSKITRLQSQSANLNMSQESSTTSDQGSSKCSSDSAEYPATNRKRMSSDYYDTPAAKRPCEDNNYHSGRYDSSYHRRDRSESSNSYRQDRNNPAARREPRWEHRYQDRNYNSRNYSR